METQSIKVSPLLVLMEEKYGYLYDENAFKHRVTGEKIAVMWNDNGTIASGFELNSGEEVFFSTPVNNSREYWVDRKTA